MREIAMTRPGQNIGAGIPEGPRTAGTIREYPDYWSKVDVRGILAGELGFSDETVEEFMATHCLRPRQRSPVDSWLSITHQRQVAINTNCMLSHGYGYEYGSVEKTRAYRDIGFALAEWVQPTAEAAVNGVLLGYKNQYHPSLEVSVRDPFGMRAQCDIVVPEIGIVHACISAFPQRPVLPEPENYQPDSRCSCRLLPCFQKLYEELLGAGWWATSVPEYHRPPMTIDWVKFVLTKNSTTSTGRRMPLELQFTWYQEQTFKPEPVRYKSMTFVSPGFFDRVFGTD